MNSKLCKPSQSTVPSKSPALKLLALTIKCLTQWDTVKSQQKRQLDVQHAPMMAKFSRRSLPEQNTTMEQLLKTKNNI
jgi:hypothetical protein